MPLTLRSFQILNNIIYHKFLMEFVVTVQIICQRYLISAEREEEGRDILRRIQK